MKKRNIKAQAAMEFMMTYGWALLAITLIIGAIAYTGVLNIHRLLPNECFISNNLVCDEVSANSQNISLFIINGLGYDIDILRINVTSVQGDCIGRDFEIQNVNNSDSARIDVVCVELDNETIGNNMVEGKLYVQYNITKTGSIHELYGNVRVQI